MRLATAMGADFVNFSNLPLRIAALPLHHTFVSPQTLLAHVSRHLMLQARPLRACRLCRLPPALLGFTFRVSSVLLSICSAQCSQPQVNTEQGLDTCMRMHGSLRPCPQGTRDISRHHRGGCLL